MSAEATSTPITPRFGKPKRPNRRTREAPPVRLGTNAKMHALLSMDWTYEIAQDEPRRRADGGRPREWPAAFISAVRVMEGIQQIQSTRELQVTLASDPYLLDAIWDGVERTHQGDEGMLDWVKGARLKKPLPSRSTVQRWIATGDWDREEALTRSALTAADVMGSFDPDAHSGVLNLQRCVVADGKVLSPPTNLPPTTVDAKTGEKYERRHDPASKVYHQGGGEAVFGPKIADLLVPTPDACTNELVLAVIPVDKNDPKSEAREATEALVKFDARLREVSRGKRYVSALVMDGAPDGEIHRQLNASGIGLLAPPSRTRSGDKETKVERVHTTGSFKVGGRAVRLRWRGSCIFEMVNVNGVLTEIQRTAKYRTVRPRFGSCRAPLQYLEIGISNGGEIRVPFNRMTGENGQPTETEKAYHHRLGLMRAAQKGDPVWEESQLQLRGMVEGYNRRLEDSLPNGRMTAYGRDRQMRKLILRAIANNMLCIAQYRISEGLLPSGAPQPPRGRQAA